MQILERTSSFESIKILLIGDADVGKSSLLLRYSEDLFTYKMESTIALDYKFKDVSYAGTSYKLQIWDTAGQERFRSITSKYYTCVKAVVIVYDIACKRSFEHVADWVKEVNFNTQDPKIIKILVGNKCDLQDKRQVSTEEGRQLAASENFSQFLEVSSKDNINIKEIFEAILRAYTATQVYQPKIEKTTSQIVLSHRQVPQQTKQEKKKCC